jgi:hypothetical protein
MEIRDEIALHTGDILLFRGNTYLSYALEYFGYSKYSHVGIIIKNPSFLDPDLEDGLYVLESTMSNDTPDAENHRYKSGVQLHKLDEILQECNKGSVFVRQIHCVRDEAFYKRFAAIHEDIHDRPYDLCMYDWICAKYNLDRPLPVSAAYQSTKQFWCSALVCYVFRELGLIEKDVNWSLVAPREFSSDEGKYLRFTCRLNQEKNIY